MDLSNLLEGVLENQIVSVASEKMGIEKDKAQSAIISGISLLMGALNNNAKNGDAQNINKALEKDHDGSILDNIQGLFGSKNVEQGSSILKHILGSKQKEAEAEISKSSGLDHSQVSKILAMLAPLVMGYLAKQKRSQNADSGEAMTNILGDIVSGMSSKDQKGGILDSAISMGTNILGNLLKNNFKG